MNQQSFYSQVDKFSDDLLELVERFCDGSAERFSAARTALMEAHQMCASTLLFDEENPDEEEDEADPYA
jgi:hypothetical protein